MSKYSLKNGNINKEELIRWAIANSNNMGDAIEKIGCNKNSGGGYRTLKNAILKFKIDVSHFKKIRRKTAKNDNDEDLFKLGSNLKRKKIKKRFIELSGYSCAICSNDGMHCGKSLTLQIDHINGNACDNRIENLRLLCPNCHTQTENYCSKNKVKHSKNAYNVLSRSEYLSKIRAEWLEKEANNIKNVVDANIDFMQRGWVNKVAKILNIHRQKVRKWMDRALPDIKIVTNKRLSYLE